VLPACDVLDTEPIASLEPDVVFANESNFRAALNGTYSALQGFYDDYTIMPDLQSDNAAWTGSFPSWQQVDQITDIPANNAEVAGQWNGSYNLINLANSVIEFGPSVPTTPSFSEEDRTALVAEAKVLRAFAYHNLVRWFGGVPLSLTPTTPATPDADLYLERSSVDAVYAQIIQDLQEAETELPAAGPSPRVSANAAKALLSRVYLYRNDYAAAAAKAQEVISTGDFSVDEPVWFLAYSVNDQNSLAFFSGLDRGEYAPTLDLINAFEAGDTRLDNTIGLVGGAATIIKYTDVATGTDPLFPIRYAEVILNRAEALARTGNNDGARDLVNQIRNAAGLADLDSSVSGNALIDAILQERRIELAFEGHHWHDLVRTNRAQSELGFSDNSYLLWPIPERELDINEKLEQNPGY
jgi:hypothetical protein